MKPQTVRLGVVADVQYAEKPDAEGRSYRASLQAMKKAADAFNSTDLDFVIQLGDLIDGGEHAAEELQRAVSVFDRVHTAKYHVVGNHDFVGLSRPAVLSELKLTEAYYSFDVKGCRFVVLDTVDYAVQGGWPEMSEHFREGCRMLDDLRGQGLANAQEYNGAIGLAQLEWLEETLAGADSKQMPVIVFGHLPLRPEGEKHTLWNADKVVAMFAKHPCVKAYMAGHNHAGGYTLHNGIHYITLESMVNAAAGDGAWGIVTVSDKKLKISGFGVLTSRMLPIRQD